MKQKKKFSPPNLFEYRVKYNVGAEHSALDSYHYYNAKNASEALEYHNITMQKKGVPCQNISVEKKNPYSNRWEDETDEISQYI